MTSRILLFDLLNELAFFMFLYQFVFRYFLSWFVKEWASQQPWFFNAVKRKGLFAANGQEDVILQIVTSLHHLTFGFLMLLGALVSSDRLFKWGCFGELAFEILDLGYNALSLFPYDQGRIKPTLRAAAAFHHVPGVLLTIPLVYYNVHSNPHLKLLGGYVEFFLVM
jgi:hypothetical protein